MSPTLRRLARRVGPAVGLALLAATSAHAATYYVAPGGDDRAPGTSPRSAWRTIARANASLRPGDLCRILPGRYEDAIRPLTNGRPRARIRYLGDRRAPGEVEVAEIALAKSWITVQGVTCVKALSLAYEDEGSAARFDSVTHCAVGGVDFAGAKDCMVANNRVRGPVNFVLDRWAVYGPARSNCERDTLRGNRIEVRPITSKAFLIRGYTQRCLIEGNRLRGTFAGPDADVYGRYLYNAYDNVFRGNRWEFEAENAASNGNPWVAFALRDSSSRNRFERDTMWCGLASGVPIGGRLVNAGNAAWVGRCRGNAWRQCFYKTTGFIWAQDDLVDATLDRNVFVSRDAWALYVVGAMRGTALTHNTFHSAGGTAMWVEGDTRGGGNTVRGNVFTSGGAPTRREPIVKYAQMGGVRSDYNLYHASRDGAAGSPEFAICAGGSCGGPGWASGRALRSGNDVHSTFGSPAYRERSFARFDGRPGRGSRALGAGPGRTTAGAHAAGR